MSEANPTSASTPFHISGDMYSGVPRTLAEPSESVDQMFEVPAPPPPPPPGAAALVCRLKKGAVLEHKKALPFLRGAAVFEHVFTCRLTMPKSMILTTRAQSVRELSKSGRRSPVATIMFESLMSRWTTPVAWMAAGTALFQSRKACLSLTRCCLTIQPGEHG